MIVDTTVWRTSTALRSFSLRAIASWNKLNEDPPQNLDSNSVGTQVPPPPLPKKKKKNTKASTLCVCALRKAELKLSIEEKPSVVEIKLKSSCNHKVSNIG